MARTIVAVVKAAAENSDWRLLDTRLLFDAADHAARSATSLRPFAPPAWPVAPARKASLSGIRVAVKTTKAVTPNLADHYPPAISHSERRDVLNQAAAAVTPPPHIPRPMTHSKLDTRGALPEVLAGRATAAARPATYVGVTMSLHKLTAGSGYDYLTRQVAALDATDQGHVALADYYSAKGESPGHWVGAGMDGIDGMAVGDAVTTFGWRSLLVGLVNA